MIVLLKDSLIFISLNFTYSNDLSSFLTRFGGESELEIILYFIYSPMTDLALINCTIRSNPKLKSVRSELLQTKDSKIIISYPF